MPIEYDSRKFHDEMALHGLILPVGVEGIFGRGPVFEDVLARFDALITKLSANDGAERMVFPPTINRKVLEKSEYLDSFPNLAGIVFSFFGNDAAHAEMRDCIHNGKPWGQFEGMTDVVLNPAACYPCYPILASKPLPENGRLIDMQNWVFRHEPSIEPTRMQAFRVREFVRAGSPDMVVDWRNMWLERGVNLLTSLGLPAKSDVASDPFFGRGGRMLAANQRDQKLKFEVLIPVISLEKPTACCSFNYHQEHFGSPFGIKTAAGETAHTACLGFGLERCVMALFRHHGCDVKAWPAEVRKKLWS